MYQLSEKFKECQNANHTLVDIYWNGNEMDQDVVRWCKICGAIVVDRDYDGRTNPGQVKKMQFPLNFLNRE